MGRVADGWVRKHEAAHKVGIFDAAKKRGIILSSSGQVVPALLSEYAAETKRLDERNRILHNLDSPADVSPLFLLAF